MNKQSSPNALEKRVVAVLGGNGNLPSVAELQELIRDTAESAQANFDAAESERVKALDLVSCPDPAEAHERIAAAKLSAERFSVALPKLRDKLRSALAAEEKDRWWSDYKKVKTQLDEAVTLFKTYDEHAQAIAQMFALAATVDKTISDLNGRAPNDEHRRLRSVEQTARCLTLSRENPSLASQTILPLWNHSSRTLWPQRPSTGMAADFAQSMMPAPHPGARWGEPDERERRRAEAEKENAQMADYHQTAQKNEDDRINAAERERFRQAHPRV
jgi:hypothetical protein